MKKLIEIYIYRISKIRNDYNNRKILQLLFVVNKCTKKYWKFRSIQLLMY